MVHEMHIETPYTTLLLYIEQTIPVISFLSRYARSAEGEAVLMWQIAQVAKHGNLRVECRSQGVCPFSSGSDTGP